MHANKGPVECNALQGRLAEWQSSACGGTIRSIGIALWITIKLFFGKQERERTSHSFHTVHGESKTDLERLKRYQVKVRAALEPLNASVHSILSKALKRRDLSFEVLL